MARNSVASIAFQYGLFVPEIESWWGAKFSAPAQESLEGPPSLLYSGYQMISWSKVAGVCPYLSTCFSAEFKERVELYFYSPSVL